MATAQAAYVDWGSSALRIWLVDAGGRILAQRRAPQGIGQLGGRAPLEVLDACIGGMVPADVPLLAAGMAGSRSGWREAPYATCPATLADWAGTALAAPGRAGALVLGGVAQETPRHDVMRGEELLVFGAARLLGIDSFRACLPGTHGKWVRYQAGAIREFATAMTGELYALLRSHGLLAAVCADGSVQVNAQAFAHGLDAGATTPLASALFGVRAKVLLGALEAADAADYLSGVLIGHEVHAFARANDDAPLLLMADEPLVDRYTTALARMGQEAQRVDAEAATLAGFAALREQLGR